MQGVGNGREEQISFFLKGKRVKVQVQVQKDRRLK